MTGGYVCVRDQTTLSQNIISDLLTLCKDLRTYVLELDKSGTEITLELAWRFNKCTFSIRLKAHNIMRTSNKLVLRSHLFKWEKSLYVFWQF